MTGDRSAVHGRILAASGDQVIAAEATFGSGAVTLMGVDPTGDWLARTPASDAVWNRLVPPRSLGAQLVTATTARCSTRSTRCRRWHSRRSAGS